MRAKKIVLRDALTRIPVVVLQFDATDDAFCKAGGFGTGLKVILKFHGRRVSCIGGYEFMGKHTIVSDLINEFVPEATIMSFGAIVDQADNISHLPDEINVEETRMALYAIDREPLLHDHFYEVLQDYENYDDLRKAIYINYYQAAQIAVLDIKNNEVLLVHGSKDVQSEIASYLWLDLKEAFYSELQPHLNELEFKEAVFPAK